MPSSLLQVVNSLFQTCCKFVNRFVTTCLPTCNNLCVFTCEAVQQLVASLLSSTTLNLVASCQQGVDNLSTNWEQAVRTHPVDKLLEQHCYKSAAGLLQLVRFYVCIHVHMSNESDNY
jgi:hypothetical protein